MKGKGNLNNEFRDARKINDCRHTCSKAYNLGSKLLFAFRIDRPVMLAFLCFTWLCGTNGFSLDITSSIEFDGPNKGSYYGYTVAMMNNKGQDRWILFGAPKDRSANLPNAEKPGAIYKCTFTNDFSSRTCDELFVDDNDGAGSAPFYWLFRGFNKLNRSFEHGRDNQWLGASLDVQHGRGIVTCASRWFNKYFEEDGYFFMNGLCYTIPLDFKKQDIETIPALVDAQKQTMTVPGSNITKLNYGMGNLGGSVHYTTQGSLLLGAPGLRYFTGGFIEHHMLGDYITEYTKAPTEINEMLGYAMTSGQYFGDWTYYAVGAPRDHLTGKVYLFEASRNSFVLEEAMTLSGSEITEIPMNGYYGAALCSADVNKDGIDDLLVAAPFYSKGEREDTGVVFVYLGQADKKFKPMSTMLTGSDKAGARFGSAMASLGDINKDTYNDIVVGAPYEDELQGAIYVYNGCKTGVWPHHTQRISAADLRTGLMSFGISFSKSEDMDGDGVNDIAVGAYLSDKAYLLFGRSVFNVYITVETSVTQIDKDTIEMCPSTNGSSIAPCFKVDVCFRYNNRELFHMSVKVTVLLDTYMGDYNRIAWQRNGNSMTSFFTHIHSGFRKCMGQKDVLIKSTSDLITPVRIKASYDVTTKYFSSDRDHPTINIFDGENPDKQILIATRTLEFKKDCPNNECETDLRLTAQAVFGTSDNYFILGHSNLTIDVSILKTGDPSYSSNFFIAFPNTLQYQQVKKVYGDPEINCGFVNRGPDDSEEGDIESLDYLQRRTIPKVSEDEFLLACSFGNPMYNDTGVRFQLSIVVPETINMTQLEFKLNANTLNTERKLADNVKTITVQVRKQVKTTFSGISRPTCITVREEAKKYLTSHIYELRNNGPIPLPSSDLLILYPQVQQGGKTYLHLNTKIHWDCAHPCTINCSFQDNMQPTYVIDKTRDESIGESKTIADMNNQDCSKGGCSRYECKLYDIPARESAVVTLEFVARGDILATTNDGEGMKVRSVANVRLLEQHRLISDIKEHNIAVYTELLTVTPSPKQAPWWIFLLSALAGLVIMVLVVIILWKVGFFKREQMEQMKKMQYEVQKRRQKMASVGREVSGYKQVQKEGQKILPVHGEVSGYENKQKKSQTSLPVDGEVIGYKNKQKKRQKSLPVGGEVSGYKKGGTK